MCMCILQHKLAEMLEKVLVVVDGVLIQTLVVMFLVVTATVILPVYFHNDCCVDARKLIIWILIMTHMLCL